MVDREHPPHVGAGAARRRVHHQYLAAVVLGAGAIVGGAGAGAPECAVGAGALMQDQAFFSAIQRKLAEPANGGQSFFSRLWTHAELVRSAQDQQDALLKVTHLQIGMAALTEILDNDAVDLPDDWIATVAVIRVDPTTLIPYLLDLADSWIADHGDRTLVAASGRPILCGDAEGLTRQLRLYPAPAIASTLLLYYVPRGAELTGQGEELTVPDELGLPVLQYAILGDLLKKIGRGQDLVRSAYCQERVTLGVEVTDLLLKGLS